MDIDTAYIRLSLSQDESETVPDTSITEEGAQSILVLGEPGSGKSSMTRKLFREACKQASVRPRSGRAPIHLELRNLPWNDMPADADEGEAWILEQVEAEVLAVKQVHDAKFVFDSFADGAGLLLFLDGLDEVPSTAMQGATEALRMAIAQLVRRSEKTTVVITARVQIWHALPRTFVQLFDRVYEVKPFSDADTFAFLRRWQYQSNALAEATRLHNELQRHPTLAAMCTTPLILAMYVAHDQAQSSADHPAVRLPENRPEFYARVVGELLLYRRDDQFGTRTAMGSQVRRGRERLLGTIALEHLLHPRESRNSISWERAVLTAQRMLGSPSLADAESELRQLALDTGIFGEERQGETLRFLHLSLLEYLAAREALEEPSKHLPELLRRSTVVDDHVDKTYRMWEVIVFSLALAGREQRLDGLHKLKESQAPVDLTLRVIRESQAYEIPEYPAAVEELKEQLQSSESWDRNWFVSMRLLTSCLIDYDRSRRVRALPDMPEASLLIQEVAVGDAKRFDRLFDMLVEADAEEALRLAGRAIVSETGLESSRLIRSMQNPGLVAAAIDRVGRDEDLDFWCLVLAEAALRHELVARILLDQPIPDSMRPNLDAVSKPHRWDQVPPVRDTLYGAILARATHTYTPNVDGVSDAPRLAILSRIPAASSRQTFWAAGFGTFALLVLPAAFGLGFLVFSNALFRDGLLGSPLALIALILVPVATTASVVQRLFFGADLTQFWVSTLPGGAAETRQILLNLRKGKGFHALDVILWLPESDSSVLVLSRASPPTLTAVTVRVGMRGRPVRATVHPKKHAASIASLVKTTPLEQGALVLPDLDDLRLVSANDFSLDVRKSWTFRRAIERV